MAEKKKKTKGFYSEIDEDNLEEFRKICRTSGQKVSGVINILIWNFIQDVRDGKIKLFGRNAIKEEAEKSHN